MLYLQTRPARKNYITKILQTSNNRKYTLKATSSGRTIQPPKGRTNFAKEYKVINILTVGYGKLKHLNITNSTNKVAALKG